MQTQLKFSLLFSDFAITTKTKIRFFDGHWNELTSAAHQFDQLSALTLDETENIVYFNDQSHTNGSIFSLRLANDLAATTTSVEQRADIIEKIIQRTQNESIGAITYDPVKRRLYWSDRLQRKIFFAAVDAESIPSVLVDFSQEKSIPDGLALDICRRRLYWTNINFKNASIESVNLNGQDRQLLIKENLYLPHGIIVDQLTDRLYWVVDQQGDYYSVESAKLDGSEREVLVEGLNNIPLHLSVTPEAIFWTDSIHNAVWSHAKQQAKNNTTDSTEVEKPRKVLSFTEQPYGIVAHTRFLSNLENDEHCKDIVKEIKSRMQLILPTTERYLQDVQDYCLNNGEEYYLNKPHTGNRMCVCKMGFEGVRCEINVCKNYCLHGECSMSSIGVPQCTCPPGYQGRHCHLHKCAGYCLNGGTCKLNEHSEAECECSDSFGGARCEHNSTEICALYCRLLQHEPELQLPLGCQDICSEQLNLALPKYTHLDSCKNASNISATTICVLTAGVAFSLLFVLLIVHALRRIYKPARPRIKKTFVVRKEAASRTCPDTPLTNRPLATEQCEITIENCCNMNICETPCFDPKLVQQSLTRETHMKEDRKMLIHNMEDDLY